MEIYKKNGLWICSNVDNAAMKNLKTIPSIAKKDIRKKASRSKKQNKFLEHALEIYKKHSAGGLLHVVLDDDNIDDYFLINSRKEIDKTCDPLHVSLKQHYYACIDILESVCKQTRLKYVYKLAEALYE